MKTNNNFSHAIQVCWKLNQNNLQRELNGLNNAMKTAKIKNGLIITFDQEDSFENISVVPIWKWKFELNV
jgi:predicted AAA+ superfamily ATPase